MSFKAYGTSIFTADMTSKPALFQPFSPTRNRIIKVIRTCMIFFNDPQFTTAQMEIWRLNKSGDLWKKLAESRPRSKADLCEKLNGIKYCHFIFDDFPSLKRGDDFALVLRLNAYTGDGSSHVAWVREADPFMDHSVTPIGTAQITRAPYIFSVIGDRF